MGRGEKEDDTMVPLLKQEVDEYENGRVFEEVKKQLWLAGPLICVSLLQYSLQLVSIMFVGHLGELSLSAASMATSFATVTGFSLFVCIYNMPSLLTIYLNCLKFSQSYIFL